jgi:hypothetical protein
LRHRARFGGAPEAEKGPFRSEKGKELSHCFSRRGAERSDALTRKRFERLVDDVGGEVIEERERGAARLVLVG